ncbi:RdgB/HAM1 family non-canonical purine NTP pyrophosphatase [Acidiphilium sp.]|uniref:RdgB/HAM1 family non-canonical purine NTP pyrophosphatase n=1 Tax=Acidiphilium sp. TaxID=527 RepID=UPI003D06A008
MPPERGQRLIIATHNVGKLAEFALLLAPHGLNCVASGALNLPEPAETAPDFAGNAQIKAIAAARATGDWALADDSGLSVSAMGGAPGVRSARFAIEAGGYPQALANIIAATRVTDHAAFVCAICLAAPSGDTATYLGFCHGTIAAAPRGSGGFGYDPIFIPTGSALTFGEMDKSTKAAISHRGRALRQVLAALFPSDPLERYAFSLTL